MGLVQALWPTENGAAMTTLQPFLQTPHGLLFVFGMNQQNPAHIDASLLQRCCLRLQAHTAVVRIQVRAADPENPARLLTELGQCRQDQADLTVTGEGTGVTIDFTHLTGLPAMGWQGVIERGKAAVDNGLARLLSCVTLALPDLSAGNDLIKRLRHKNLLLGVCMDIQYCVYIQYSRGQTEETISPDIFVAEAMTERQLRRPVRWQVLGAAMALLLPAGASALEGYGEFGLGVTFVEVDQPLALRSEDRKETVADETLFAGGAVQWLPFVSTGLQMWIWGDRRVDANATEKNIDGIGVAADVTVRFPFDAFSPYARYSRVCWDMLITGLDSNWSEEACSSQVAAGLGFGLRGADGRLQRLNIEYSRMTLTDDAVLSQLVATMQVSF